MYESFFGLHKKPFELVPNPDFLFQSKTHSRVGVYLDYAMKENSGFVLLTGEVGAGKTTIIRNLVRNLGPDVQIAKIFNTKLESLELLATINDDFGLPIDGRNKVQLLKDLYQFLIEQFARQQRAVLIIDEAQNLSVDSLEELRLLSNLETNDAKLLQIVLVGQPELKKILSVPELRQLRQRIGIHCHLQSLSREEAESYIFHRLEIAGNRRAVLFEDDALDLIFEYTGGIPRLINILCDFLLLSAFSEGEKEISAQMVTEVAEDTQFEGQFQPRTTLLKAAPKPLAPMPGQVKRKTEKSPPAVLPSEKDAPAASAPTVAPEDRTRIEELYRRLDYFAASIREIHAATQSGESAVAAAPEPEIVLNMPRFDDFPLRKPGLFSGLLKMFFR